MRGLGMLWEMGMEISAFRSCRSEEERERKQDGGSAGEASGRSN
jgi:hypothetical protein